VAADDHPTLAPGAYVTLSVSDTGAGMDAETRRRVFEPFFTTKASGVGTGLGLSTVFSIVEQSQGRIVVSSEPYAGTTFTVYLPQTDEPLTASSVVPLRRPTDAASETVLLVEDEDGVRTLAARTLRQRGYRVFEARYAREALEIWGTESSEIDLLLTDIVMPGMSGVELAEKIAAHGEDTKIVLMSGYSGPGDAGAVGTPGQIAFLEKPFTQSALLDVVRKTLDGR
jgi:two-component system, cell cycle sensor histidine kinase and response regulator CckA